MKSVAFRVDSSHIIGTGHVMRCLGLAEEFTLLGYQCLFVTYPHASSITSVLSQAGFQVLHIPFKKDASHDSTDTSQWLMNEEEDDAQIFLRLIPNNCRFVIVDHYAIGEKWHNQVRAKVAVIAIDDLGNRPMAPDILIDYNINNPAQDRYRVLTPERTKLWLGTQYILLRREYFETAKVPKTGRRQFENIFIFMGGADIQNYTELALELVTQKYRNSKAIKAIIGSSNLNSKQIVKNFSKFKCLELIKPQKNIVDILAWADLAIGAFGSTAYERAVMALPAIGIIMADNQRSIAQAFSSNGFAWAVDCQVNDVKRELSLLLESLTEEDILKASSNLELNFRVGGGAKMIAEKIHNLMKKQSSND